MHFTLFPRLLIMEPRLFIMDIMLFIMEESTPGSMAGADDELDEMEDELLLEEDLDDAVEEALEEALDDAAAEDFTTGFTGLLMMRASVVQRPGTIWSSSDVQCSMPEQSLGE